MCKTTSNGIKLKTKNNHLIATDDGKCLSLESSSVVKFILCDRAANPIEWKGDRLSAKGKWNLEINAFKFMAFYITRADGMKFRRLNPSRGELNIS